MRELAICTNLLNDETRGLGHDVNEPLFARGDRSKLNQEHNVVGGLQQAKILFVAGFGVVRVQPRRQEPVDAVDRLSIRVGADLEKLVVILHRRAHGSPQYWT